MKSNGKAKKGTEGDDFKKNQMRKINEGINMKLYAVKSRTPILDLISIVSVSIFYLSGFSNVVCKWVLGDSANEPVNGSISLLLAFQLCVMFVIAIGSMIFVLFAVRNVASKFFNIKTGDGYIELDTKTNTSKVFIDGQEMEQSDDKKV